MFKGMFRGLAGFIVLIVIAVLSVDLLMGSQVKKIDYTEFLDLMKNKQIEQVQLSNDRTQASVTLKADESGKKQVKNQVSIPNTDTLMGDISESLKNNEFKFAVMEPTIFEIISAVLPTIGLVVIMILFLVVLMAQTGQGKNGATSFGRSRAKLNNPNDSKKVVFADVAGLDEEKEELQEIVEFLKDPKKYTELGARIPKGVLLFGSPGTGKTLLAKAVAGEAGVPFYSISGSDFVEMFVGVGASRVRDLFDTAKKTAPCIVFIDEIDAVGRHRGAGLGGGHDEREQTLNQLLVEMDGFSPNENIIVMAATNRPDILDPALLRPGRFDREIVVGAPDVKAREDILRLYAKNKPIDDNIDWKVIAKNTVGFSGADLENMVNESALIAAKRNKNKITNEDVEEAMVKVMMGPEKRSKVISEKEKKLTAYHEGGHAVVSRFLPSQDNVHQISIVPRGMAGGYTMYKPNEDKSYTSKTEMEEMIVSLLGGRVAEKLVLNDISTGASNDIERASKIARSMVMKYGMSDEIGPITFGTTNEEVFMGRDLNQQRNYSESLAAKIDTEVKSIIDTAYNRALQILKDNMDKLHKVAAVLLEREKIESEDFEKIMRGEELTDQKEEKTENKVKKIKAKKLEKEIEDNTEKTE